MASTHRCTPSSASHRKPSLVRSICSRQCECPPGTTSKSIRPFRTMPTSLYPQVLVSTSSSTRQRLRNRRLLQVTRSLSHGYASPGFAKCGLSGTLAANAKSRCSLNHRFLPQGPALLLVQPAALLLRTGASIRFGSAAGPRAVQSTRHLLIYSIDVEGGQSTLLVAPSGASLLVDTGWPNHDGRDAVRIQAAMKDAGI